MTSARIETQEKGLSDLLEENGKQIFQAREIINSDGNPICEAIVAIDPDKWYLICSALDFLEDIQDGHGRFLEISEDKLGEGLSTLFIKLGQLHCLDFQCYALSKLSEACQVEFRKPEFFDELRDLRNKFCAHPLNCRDNARAYTVHSRGISNSGRTISVTNYGRGDERESGEIDLLEVIHQQQTALGCCLSEQTIPGIKKFHEECLKKQRLARR